MLVEEEVVSYLQMGYDAIIQLVLILVLRNPRSLVHLLEEELVLAYLQTDYGVAVPNHHHLIQRSSEGSMAVGISVVEEELAEVLDSCRLPEYFA